MIKDVALETEITVRPIQAMGADYMVAAAARVSTSGEDAWELAGRSNDKEVKGLINYLMKHRHGTPFEHGAMTFFVHAPIFVFREWHRHRVGFSYNEESGRYKKLDPVFWIPRRDRPMVKSEGYKAARPTFIPLEDDHVYRDIVARSSRTYQEAYSAYIFELDQGIANEVARRLLPVGIYSSCWVTCNPRSLMHFLSLRVHDEQASFISYPQVEIQEAALACEDMFKKGWPITYQAFIDNGRVAP